MEDGFETSLKQGSDSTVFSIEPHADPRVEGHAARHGDLED
jgi:hypothetical protein